MASLLPASARSPASAPNTPCIGDDCAALQALRPLDPMNGMMGSRYGVRRPPPPPPRPFVEPPPTPPPAAATEAPTPPAGRLDVASSPAQSAEKKTGHEAKAVERARRVWPSTSGKIVKVDVLNPETIRGRVMLVLGWMSHDLRDKPMPRMVTPRNDEDLPEIHREDIVVRCWQVYGAPFAMHRHDYPNSNSVQSKICDLTTLGLVRPRTTNTLSLTTRGWWWWRKALAVYGGSVSDPAASGLFEREAPAVSSGESSGAR